MNKNMTVKIVDKIVSINFGSTKDHMMSQLTKSTVLAIIDPRSTKRSTVWEQDKLDDAQQSVHSDTSQASRTSFSSKKAKAGTGTSTAGTEDGGWRMDGPWRHTWEGNDR